MEGYKRYETKIRAKIIGYSLCDFFIEEEPKLMASDFFSLEQQCDSFEQYVDGLGVSGREKNMLTLKNALEAFYMALNANWVLSEDSYYSRQIIVMVTDSGCFLPKSANKESIKYEMLTNLIGQLKEKEDAFSQMRVLTCASEECFPWINMYEENFLSLYSGNLEFISDNDKRCIIRSLWMYCSGDKRDMRM